MTKMLQEEEKEVFFFIVICDLVMLVVYGANWLFM